MDKMKPVVLETRELKHQYFTNFSVFLHILEQNRCSEKSKIDTFVVTQTQPQKSKTSNWELGRKNLALSCLIKGDQLSTVVKIISCFWMKKLWHEVFFQ